MLNLNWIHLKPIQPKNFYLKIIGMYTNRVKVTEHEYLSNIIFTDTKGNTGSTNGKLPVFGHSTI